MHTHRGVLGHEQTKHWVLLRLRCILGPDVVMRRILGLDAAININKLEFRVMKCEKVTGGNI